MNYFLTSFYTPLFIPHVSLFIPRVFTFSLSPTHHSPTTSDHSQANKVPDLACWVNRAIGHLAAGHEGNRDRLGAAGACENMVMILQV